MAVIPVFISSTFRDFHAERDVLRRVVTPALNAAAAPFGATVELLDLRWGVDTSNADDETAAQQLVLDVCLQEIDRCRPLFVGLLGDRFGWVPPRDQMANAVGRIESEHDAPSREAPMSVTALEVWYGGLSPNTTAIFALRELQGDVPSTWREDPAGVSWLRAEVRAAAARDPLRVRTFDYPLRISQGDREPDTGDLDDFATRMVCELEPLVVGRAKESLSTATTPYAAAATLLEESRRRVLAGRDDLVKQAVGSLCEQRGTSDGLVLLGGSGAGKTSVFVAVCDTLQSLGRRVASVFVGAGPGSSSTEDVIRLLAAQVIDSPDLVTSLDYVYGDELVSTWSRALAGMDADIVIAVDGLDRMSPGRARELLEFVPSESTEGTGPAWFFTTNLPEQRQVLTGRNMREVAVEPLSASGAAIAARGWAAASGRVLPAHVVDVLADRERSALWVRLAIDSLDWLGRPSFVATDRAVSAGANANDAIIEMLCNHARGLPAKDRELATAILTRAADMFRDPASGEKFLAILAATRSGVAPQVLEDSIGVDALTAGRARWSLGGQLTQRDPTGRLAFDHALVRQAAQEIVGAKQMRQAHAALAKALLAPSESSSLRHDPTATEDATWHAVNATSASLLGTALSAGYESTDVTATSLAGVLVEAMVEGRHNAGFALDAVVALPDQRTLPNERAGLLVLQECLALYGETTLRADECRLLVGPMLALSERNAPLTSDDHLAFRDHARTLEIAARVDSWIGQPEAAAELLKRALNIRQKLVETHPGNDALILELAECLTRYGEALKSSGRKQSAPIPLWQAQKLLAQIIEERHPDTDVDSALAELSEYPRDSNVWLLWFEVFVLLGEVGGDRSKAASGAAQTVARRFQTIQGPPASEDPELLLARALLVPSEVGYFGEELRSAKQDAQEAEDLAASLVRRNPFNMRYLSILAKSRVLLYALKTQLAETTFETDIDRLEDTLRVVILMSESDPQRASYYQIQGDARIGLAAGLEATGHPFRGWSMRRSGLLMEMKNAKMSPIWAWVGALSPAMLEYILWWILSWPSPGMVYLDGLLLVELREWSRNDLIESSGAAVSIHRVGDEDQSSTDVSANGLLAEDLICLWQGTRTVGHVRRRLLLRAAGRLTILLSLLVSCLVLFVASGFVPLVVSVVTALLHDSGFTGVQLALSQFEAWQLILAGLLAVAVRALVWANPWIATLPG